MYRNRPHIVDIFAGKRPVDDLARWGYEPRENWGILATEKGQKVIPSEQGRYHDYYEAFAEAVKTGGAPPRCGSGWGAYTCGLGCGTSKCA